MRVYSAFVFGLQMQFTLGVTKHGPCLLGSVSHKIEIGHGRGLLRTDVFGVKRKTIKDSRKTSWNAAWSLVGG